eukprot:CAMPEP_0114325246 /NCGR_PEP_ID=MMETSP0059-20121206/28997_1 /TAXON_ID=36894 /ORGANISM="Pyramimonas parkeae, Strain CCMP726" /LENGTH=105 /DNA_ID=CAMNT_0001453957 /DNA_START=36 /DNA_END=353 /DNA_ORIENTATION=+
MTQNHYGLLFDQTWMIFWKPCTCLLPTNPLPAFEYAEASVCTEPVQTRAHSMSPSNHAEPASSRFRPTKKGAPQLQHGSPELMGRPPAGTAPNRLLHAPNVHVYL